MNRYIQKKDVPKAFMKKIKGIKGFGSDRELEFTYHLAPKIKGIALEIGSWYGRNTTILGLRCNAPIVCVDPHIGELTGGYAEYDRNGSYKGFLSTIANHEYADRVTLIRLPSQHKDAIAKVPSGIGYFFIDGLHTFDAAYQDITNYWDKLIFGCHIVFDDVYYPHKGCPEMAPFRKYLLANCMGISNWMQIGKRLYGFKAHNRLWKVAAKPTPYPVWQI